MSPVAPAKSPDELRDLLAAKIRGMDEPHLRMVTDLLLEIEMQETLAEVDAAFDEARAAGRLSPERIQEAIRAHRQRHPRA